PLKRRSQISIWPLVLLHSSDQVLFLPPDGACRKSPDAMSKSPALELQLRLHSRSVWYLTHRNRVKSLVGLHQPKALFTHPTRRNSESIWPPWSLSALRRPTRLLVQGRSSYVQAASV